MEQVVVGVRLTAFVDVLGWEALIDGIDSLTLRRMKRDGGLTADERGAADTLCQRVELASRLDAAVASILRELEDFAAPAGEVHGDRLESKFPRSKSLSARDATTQGLGG